MYQRPNLNFSATILERARGVRVVFFDVDGVFTDGGIYISEEGETVKRFNTLDGYGLKLLQMSGITPAIISGRDSKALRRRMGALGVEHMSLGDENKLPAAEKILQKLNLSWSEAGAMGDDWPDIPLMRRAKIACAPLNAHIEVRNLAQYVCYSEGGQGAVREFCDLLLHAEGAYLDHLSSLA